MMSDVQINCDIYSKSLVDFRDQIHRSFPHRSDAIMDLIDALSSNTTATSPVELSLNPLFRRRYGSIHDAIQNLSAAPDRLDSLQLDLQRIIAAFVPKPHDRPFYLFGIDVTPVPRPFAVTLQDRSVQYAPNPILNNKPITIGHACSTLAALPEKASPHDPPWVIPLSLQRISSDEKAIHVAIDQVNHIMTDAVLPFRTHLSAATFDSGYGAIEFLNSIVEHKNLITIVRARRNRRLYHPPTVAGNPPAKGHPVWYGDVFRMGDDSTWGPPDAETTVPFTFKNGRAATAHIQVWRDRLMRGEKDIPMHRHPFNLHRVTVLNENGQPVFKRSLWLIAIGERRHELSLSQVYAAYRQRYDLEHFFRFGKQKLLLTAYQTPHVHYEENWWNIIMLGYVQLYLMAPLANRLPTPWEAYLPVFKNDSAPKIASPAVVLRDAARIISAIGSPAQFPKRRGTAPGRQKGDRQLNRTKCPVIIKAAKARPGLSP